MSAPNFPSLILGALRLGPFRLRLERRTWKALLSPMVCLKGLTVNGLPVDELLRALRLPRNDDADPKILVKNLHFLELNGAEMAANAQGANADSNGSRLLFATLKERHYYGSFLERLEIQKAWNFRTRDASRITGLLWWGHVRTFVWDEVVQIRHGPLYVLGYDFDDNSEPATENEDQEDDESEGDDEDEYDDDDGDDDEDDEDEDEEDDEDEDEAEKYCEDGHEAEGSQAIPDRSAMGLV